MERYTADFETTTETGLIRDGFVRVWAVDVTNIDTCESVLTSNKIDDFFTWCEKDGKSKEVYFHNLKFDGTFIIDWLFRNGYTYADDKPTEKSFTCLITDMGVWYEITIYHKIFNKRYVKTVIRDSLKKLPFSVRDISKAFNLETQKLSIDYDTYREENYELSDEENDYIHNDTKIVAEALKIQFEKGLTKMTVGSDALSNFKDGVGKKGFKYLFPILDNTIDSDIRKSYKGGFVYLNPKYAGLELHNVISFDVNSLYPSVMYDNPMPYGQPKYYKGKYKYDEKYPLYIQSVNVDFDLKPDHIPTLQIKNSSRFVPTEYVTSSNGEMINLMLTSVDLALFLDQYDVHEIEYLEGFKFKQVKNLFKDYIDYWIEIKKASTGAMRTLAKLMLNSLYGKFGTNPRKCQMRPTYDKDKKQVIYKPMEETIEDSVYTALASFVTAYARNKTIRTAQSVYKHFIYADTDSIHLIGTTYDEVAKLIDVHPKDLGKWGYEGEAVRAKFLRAKTYVKEKWTDALDEDGNPTGEKVLKLFVTCSGMPDECKAGVTFEDFKLGAKFGGKLQAKRVSGGTYLRSIDFTIKR